MEGKNRGALGFTLIEVMITVAVIAVLAMVALPSYREYITRGKISEATSNLADRRVKMEQWFQDNRTYVGAPCVPGASAGVRYFTFTCTPGQPTVTTPTTFTVQAVGGISGGDQSMAGFVYTINESNVKTTAITAGSAAAKAGWTGNPNCWVTKKGGQC